MEQFFKSLLQKQGYEHIGIIDAEKKIWGYAEDGVYHFCKEDLADVNRTDVGFDFGVLVLSITDDEIRNVKHNESVSSYIIIDNSNKIIAKKNGSFHLLRINSGSLIMVLENSVSEYKVSNYQAPLFRKNFLNSIRSHFYFQIVIIDGKIEKDLYLYMYYKSFYFFYIGYNEEKYQNETKIICGGQTPSHQIVYEGKEPYVWLHKDNTLDIINLSDDMVIELISYSCKKRFNVPEMMGNSRLQKDYNDETYAYDNYNDDSVIFPFSEGEGVFVLHRKLSKVKLDYKYYNYNTYCFYFEQSGKAILHGDIIKVCIECPFSPTDYYLYDIYGNYITWFDSKTREQYKIFSKNDTSLIEKGECLYGVIELSGDYRIVIPPIYEMIKAVGGSYFEVSFKNNPLSDKECLTGVYCGEKLVVPLGIDFSYPEYHVSFSNQAKIVGLPFGIVYSHGNYKGLIMDSKVLDAKYDSIDGFSYYGDCFGEDNEYYPKSIILNKGGLKGLFFVNYNKGLSRNVIEPQYESMHCCMILNGYAYFEVNHGNKHGVISDSVEFNEISKCIYDKVEVEKRKGELILKVYKDGKIGMLSSNLRRSIPVKYSNLFILRRCYIGDGKYYSMGGTELLSEKDYVFVSDGEYCQAYKNKNTNEYVFICANGDKLDYNKRENGNIIEIKSSIGNEIYEFDVDKNAFIKNEPNNQSYDDYDYKRDTWFAMTDGQYGDMPENFDEDYDFLGR